MSLRNYLLYILCVMVSVGTGCSGIYKRHCLEEEKEIFAVSYHYWHRANESETSGDWYMAEYFYQIAYQLDPQNKDYKLKIASLRKKIISESEKYFQQGLIFYRKGDTIQAREAMLTALKINPDHHKARTYLVEIIQQPEQNIFEVKEKTDLRKIAEDFYNDPDKSFLIAYFNNIREQDIPEIGSTLIIPWAPVQKSTRQFKLEDSLSIARLYLDTKRFSQALAVTSKIREKEPDNLEATEIENAVYHQIAQEFERFGNYTDALKTILKVRSDNQSTKSYISHLTLKVKEKADQHYRSGVRFFVNEELEKAIKEWEKTLVIDPTNEMAQKDILNAKSLLEKLRQIE